MMRPWDRCSTFAGFLQCRGATTRRSLGTIPFRLIVEMVRVKRVDAFKFEPEDLRIIRALQIDPRVPFATVASVVGLSEPTVSRRYARMQRLGAVRVAG